MAFCYCFFRSMAYSFQLWDSEHCMFFSQKQWQNGVIRAPPEIVLYYIHMLLCLTRNNRCALPKPANEYWESNNPVSKLILIQREYVTNFETPVTFLQSSAKLCCIPLSFDWNPLERLVSLFNLFLLVALFINVSTLLFAETTIL